MLDFVIGLDGGGTKTMARAADLQGRPLFEIRGDSTNLCALPEQRVAEAIDGLMGEAAARASGLSGCRGLALGAAGVSRTGAPEALRAMLERRVTAAPIVVVSDWEIQLEGAFMGESGIVLNAGTGSFAVGKDDAGCRYRVGGGGHLLDDEGSGYAIGRDGLAHLLRTLDGREPPTALSRALAERYGFHSRNDVIAYAYAEASKRNVADAAQTVLALLSQGEETARQICQRGACQLALLAEAVDRQMPQASGQLALLGSMISRNEAYRTLTTSLIAKRLPRRTVAPARGDALDGAVLMALQIAQSRSIDDGKPAHQD